MDWRVGLPLTVLVIFLCVDLGWAITCFNCNDTHDYTCGYPFIDIEDEWERYQEEDRQRAKSRYGAQYNAYRYDWNYNRMKTSCLTCKKLVGMIKGRKTILRTCEQEYILKDECYKDENLDVEICFCPWSFCNAGITIKPALSLSFFLLTLTHIFKWLLQRP